MISIVPIVLSSDRTLHEQELSSTLSFSEAFSTMMACADQSVNDQEAAFNQAMSSVASFETPTVNSVSKMPVAQSYWSSAKPKRD